MPSYLVELYLPRGRKIEEAVVAARRAAEAAADGGTPIRYVRSLHLAEEETCLHMFEAPTREAVVEATRRAGLEGARVTEAVESGREV